MVRMERDGMKEGGAEVNNEGNDERKTKTRVEEVKDESGDNKWRR